MSTDAGEWAARLSAGDCELIVHGALRAGDVRGVVEGLKLLASKDPRRARSLFEVVKVALELAKAGPDGRAGVAAELRAMASAVEAPAPGGQTPTWEERNRDFVHISYGTGPSTVVDLGTEDGS